MGDGDSKQRFGAGGAAGPPMSVAKRILEKGRASGGVIASFAVRVGAAVRSAGVRKRTVAEHDFTGSDYERAQAAAAQEIGRINVLVAGNTGAGKSTLVNAVFGSHVAATGAGMPITQAITLYEAPDAPLNLWDSRGFEAGDDAAVKAVDARLAAMRGAGDPGAQIHVAWLCISAMSSRVEPVHARFLAQMQARGIPTIVVFTQSYRRMPAEARALAAPAAAQIELVAADDCELNRKAFGLKELAFATDQVLPDALRAAFAAAQKVEWGLKRQAARGVVALAAGSAIASAVAPGHSAILSVIQVGMLAKIDSIFGRSMLAGELAAVKAMLGNGARKGGEWLFGALLTDGLKATGAGYAAGVAIGGAVGGAVTTAMGLSYLEGLSRYVESGSQLDLDQLAKTVLAATAAASSNEVAATDACSPGNGDQQSETS